MHPSPSVIAFTSLSGLGFGMLFWLGIGEPVVFGRTAFLFFFVSYALAVGGLLASAFHLGNPQRALRAFSQWRTSWLSREAWASVITLSLVGLFAIGEIFLGVRFVTLGWIGAALSLLTVFTTSMIYAQLKTVPRWNHPTTPLMFLTYSLAGGALLTGQTTCAIALLALLGVLQMGVWYMAERRFSARGSTIETATGLGHMGKVRQVEAPHSGGNYLLSEMVYVVGRNHARRLQVIALLFAILLPLALLLFSGAAGWLLYIAITSHAFGLIVARWLFFAQAEHVVGLYYDKR